MLVKLDHLKPSILSGTPIGSSHDITTRWAGSALVPVSARFHSMNSPTTAAGSRLPPPPSYQAATQGMMMSPSKDLSHHHHYQHRHHLQQQQLRHSPVTSEHAPVTSSLLAPTVSAHDRKMSFQLDSSTWKDREPTHFRWNMMPLAKTDNQEFHHTLPTSYDEVTSVLRLFDASDDDDDDDQYQHGRRSRRGRVPQNLE